MGIKYPENKRNQIDLLYRDIKQQMDELRELRAYKVAITEIVNLIENNYDCPEFQEVAGIITKHIK